MKCLFVHQNFPGQFRSLAPSLARAGHEVVALTMQPPTAAFWQDVRLVSYRPRRGSSMDVHPWLADLETKVIRGEACLRAANEMRAAGFQPDVIVAHPGWGESLFLKEVWPNARLGVYCEFFYHARGADVGFDPEFPAADAAETSRIRLKNVNNLLHFDIADAGLSPTAWQASTFPEPFRSKITVVHDGIDTQAVAPNPGARLTLNGQHALTRSDELITFVNRNLEPTRGYHVFMRALPRILKERPKARVIIVGGDDVSYGKRPPAGQTWKDIYLNEVRDRVDVSRVSFVGNVPYPQFIALLQLSTVHVYLTYPFVLSWSVLEAMSAGCAIVGSDTAPVREVIEHDRTGRLVDFFDVEGLAEAVISLAADPQRRQMLGAAARAFVEAHYDLSSVSLPSQVAWVESLAPKG